MIRHMRPGLFRSLCLSLKSAATSGCWFLAQVARPIPLLLLSLHSGALGSLLPYPPGLIGAMGAAVCAFDWASNTLQCPYLPSARFRKVSDRLDSTRLKKLWQQSKSLFSPKELTLLSLDWLCSDLSLVN